MTDTAAIEAVRAFSRFYTSTIGALETGHLATSFSLSEARTIYEVAGQGRRTAAEIARAMSTDPAQISRLVARLREQGLFRLDPDPADRRQSIITLTEAGRAAFATLDAATNARVSGLLAGLDPARQGALIAALSTVRSLLGDAMPAAPLLLRPHRIGELGWLVHRQGLLYHQQYGWNIDFEALIAKLYSDYETAPATPPKALWIAERNGAVAGSVFVMPSEGRPGTAQLRMLYVEPEARGLGIGRLLVDQAVRFSRENGYARVRLWTQSVLVPARKIYAAAGFVLKDATPHHSFGVDLVGENWELDLRAAGSE
jgi:DNA-binding MarR family transcriptional regulator/GNAT superfamily N-acetyltransferase